MQLQSWPDKNWRVVIFILNSRINSIQSATNSITSTPLEKISNELDIGSGTEHFFRSTLSNSISILKYSSAKLQTFKDNLFINCAYLLSRFDRQPGQGKKIS